MKELLSQYCADPASLFLWFFTSRVDESCAPFLTWVVEPSEVTVLGYLSVFLKTVLLEAAFYFVLLRKHPWKKRVTTLLAANLCTHPAVYLLFPWLGSLVGMRYAMLLLLAEIFAPTVEILVTRKLARTAWGETTFWIVIGNLFSWWVGVLAIYG